MPYDLKKAARELQVQEDELLEILEVFFAETSETLDQCDAALASRATANLKNYFHTLKGTAANFRANALSDLAYAMEKGAVSDDFNLLARLLPQFRQEFEDMQARIRSL